MNYKIAVSLLKYILFPCWLLSATSWSCFSVFSVWNLVCLSSLVIMLWHSLLMVYSGKSESNLFYKSVSRYSTCCQCLLQIISTVIPVYYKCFTYTLQFLSSQTRHKTKQTKKLLSQAKVNNLNNMVRRLDVSDVVQPQLNQSLRSLLSLQLVLTQVRTLWKEGTPENLSSFFRYHPLLYFCNNPLL